MNRRTRHLGEAVAGLGEGGVEGVGSGGVGLAGGDKGVVGPEAECDLVDELVELVVFGGGQACGIMWVAKEELARFFRTERDSA